jgi:hypothetical protein
LSCEILPREIAGALAGACLAERQQAAEPAVGGAVGRVDEHRQTVAQIQPAADDEAEADLASPLVRPRHAGERVVVGEAERRQAEQLRLREQFLDVRGAAEKRKE